MKPFSLINWVKFTLANVWDERGEAPYQFGAYSGKCRISFFQTVFCVFEDCTLSNGLLHVGHFSVNDPFRGCRIGERCLRKFAAHIARIDPSVTEIRFTLWKLPTTANHQEIAKARLALLQRIGADNTAMTALPQGRFEVSGTWRKARW